MPDTETAAKPTAMPTAKTACLLVIGNEILSGRTQDANLAYVGARMGEWGIRLREARVIPDIEDVVVAAVNECRAKYDYVFTSGGIGPTHDDITARCIASAFGVALVRNPEAVAILTDHYDKDDLTEARLKMAETPEGAVLIDNPVSRAPGFQIDNVFVMAGIPRIMQAMLDGLRGRLIGGDPVRSITVAAFLPESRIAAGLEAVQVRYPDIDMGSYPFYRLKKFGTSLVLRGTDMAAMEAAADELRAMIRGMGEEPVEDTAAEPKP